MDLPKNYALQKYKVILSLRTLAWVRSMELQSRWCNTFNISSIAQSSEMCAFNGITMSAQRILAYLTKDNIYKIFGEIS